jgi:hypothetical protein
MSNGSKILSYNLNIWLTLVTQFDYTNALKYLLRGIQSLIYSGLIFGTVAALIVFIYLLFKSYKEGTHLIKNGEDQIEKLFLWSLFLYLLTFLSVVFLIPQTSIFSPESIQPRLAFYTYPINTIAIALIFDRLIGKYAYVIPLFTFIISNIDLSGLAIVSLFFDYGSIQFTWK